MNAPFVGSAKDQNVQASKKLLPAIVVCSVHVELGVAAEDVEVLAEVLVEVGVDVEVVLELELELRVEVAVVARVVDPRVDERVEVEPDEAE